MSRRSSFALCVVAAFVVLAVGLAAEPAWAAGDRALIYTGNEGEWVTADNTPGLASSLSEAGAAGVDYSDTWPGASLKDTYRIIFISTPTRTFSDAQVSDLLELIDAGGLIVLVGENPRYPLFNETVNDLAARLNAPMRIRIDESVGRPCGQAESVGDHPLVDNTPYQSMAYASPVEGGTPLYRRNGVYAAVSCSVVMVADANVFVASRCNNDYTNNQSFKNLWTSECEP